jgi:serine/threonine-protein kinase
MGTSEEVALGLLSDDNFEVEVIRVPNVRVERGIVFDQDPIAGELAAPGGLVTITVSTGGDYVVVPEITGSLVEQIGLQLYTYQLGVGEVVGRQDRNSIAGEILEQFPPPGEEVALGTLVDVVVSEGPPPVNVPDVRGLAEGEATMILRDAGFQVVSVRTYSSARSGTVVSTNPRADTEAEYGSEIRVVVSRGSAPTTVPPRPPTTAAPPEPPDPVEPPTTPSTPPTTRPPAPPAPSGQDGGGAQGD